MRKFWTIFSLGIFVALLPFLGFPGSWEAFFSVIVGLAVAALALAALARIRHEAQLNGKENFSKPKSFRPMQDIKSNQFNGGKGES